MTMKKTDLDKNLGLKLAGKMRQAGTPDRFSAAAAVNRREQRRLDQARGLVPFATKLPAPLIETIKARAQAEQRELADVVADLLAKALND